jgi:hypothetical protein
MLTQWNNFGPRVGIAWDPTGSGKTSVRASYGKSYEFVNAQFHLNTSVAPPWGSEVRLNAPPGGLDNPFLGSPGGQTNIFPIPIPLTRDNAVFSINGPYESLNNDMASTSVQMWNVTIERQIASSWLVSAGYVGSRTSNIWETTPLNNALFVTVNGQVPTATNINARRPLTLADPVNGKYYGILDSYVTDGTQRYNGMLLSVRRSAGRVTFNANYTLSHCYGSPDGSGGGTPNPGTGYNIPSNPGFDNGNCTADRLQNFTTTAGIESPRFERPGLRAVASGWRLVGNFRALTGPWLTISPGTDRALNGQAGTQRANQILDNPFADQSTNPQNGGIRFLTPLAFSIPALGTLGTSQRNSIRGPGNKNVDLALARSFALPNRKIIEVRAEAFNAFNWFQWGQPSTALNSPTFGQITQSGTLFGYAPRVIQFGVKYAF